MSLRRAYRDSWDAPKFKRIARSKSPSIKTRSDLPGLFSNTYTDTSTGSSSASTGTKADHSRYHATVDSCSESDSGHESYPEQRALTPEPDEAKPPRGRSLKRADEFLLSPLDPPSTGNSPVNPPGSLAALTAGAIRRVRFQDPPARSTSLPPETELEAKIPAVTRLPAKPSTSTDIEGEVETPAVTQALPKTLTEAEIEAGERDYLHSSDFPIQFLRPVPTLNQMMSQITPAMGDPGTGFTKFGPKSPQKSVFVEKISPDTDPKSHGFLKERLITPSPYRIDKLQWENRKDRTIPTKGRGYEIRLPTPAERLANRAKGNKWTGRKYSVNPDMKSRHFAFDILRRKINHHELLSLNLSVDARRDVLKIGGGETDVGGSLLFDKTRPKDTYISKSCSRSRERARNSSISTTVIPSGRTSTFASRSKVPKQETFFEPALCCNPDCVHCQHVVPQIKGKPVPKMSCESQRDDMVSVNGYDSRERRMRAQDIDSALDVGRYGIGGTMLWRLIRVAARVTVDGEETDQCAWYVVPDKALGGFF